MNAFMELSEHQCVADLLDLPCHICSDPIGFTAPHAHITIGTFHEQVASKEEESDRLFIAQCNKKDREELEGDRDLHDELCLLYTSPSPRDA